MLSRPLTLGAVFLAGFVAVGAGAYLAVRQNDANAGAVAGRTAPAGPPTEAVEATEATVNETDDPPVAPAPPEPVRQSPSVSDDAVREAQPASLAPPALPPEPPVPPAAPPIEPIATIEPAVVESPRATAEATEDTRPVAPAIVGDAEADATPEDLDAENPPATHEVSPVEPAPVSDAEAPRSADDEWIGLEQPWPEDLEPATVGRGMPTTARSTDDDALAPGLEEFAELVVAADSVIGLELDTRVSSETAQVEDRVDATVARDVLVGERVAIPAGAQLQGSVVLVEQGGRMSKAARIGVRFHTLVMPDRTHMSIVTEPIYREGDGQGGRSAKTIGGAAVTGAILGAIFGGRRGAAVGGAAGAATGTASVMTGDRSRTTLLPGMTLTARLVQPVAVLADR
ncbi:MAG: hypothetical protein QGF21_06815 [Vicinamibacterales bacterium]|nr:hypothetical protein [Vicinamibacterales bacterium]MDP7471368.1 hypothetical protein [Vicinamibacterales bacterium]MDP7671637.1 hypothetical protein [Vicinamibacterales bacterium]HJO37031.1 hypothetical protein [Vicinamibacterales bacterium]